MTVVALFPPMRNVTAVRIGQAYFGRDLLTLDCTHLALWRKSYGSAPKAVPCFSCPREPR